MSGPTARKCATAQELNANAGARAGYRLDEEELAEAERQWTADRDHWFELVARWNTLAGEAETPTWRAAPTAGAGACREYNVHVTIADVRRLASGMAVHPREFVYLKEGKEEDSSDFRFRPGGPLYDLHLLHRPDTKGCVFLMEIAPGKARCGAYVHRPMGCATFPAALDQGSVGIRRNTLCGGPDSWNLATMDLATYRRDIMRNRAAWREHLDLVEQWNARIDAAARGMTHEDLYEFILATDLVRDTEAVSAETASP